jgi:hypothetical protein
MTERLAELRAQLADVARDLDGMGAHMAGTEWHADRVDEARWLVRTIAAIELAAERDARTAVAAAAAVGVSS